MLFDTWDKYQILASLNSVSQQQVGQRVYLLEYHQHQYVAKGVRDDASVDIVEAHKKELKHYQILRDQNFCSDYQIINVKQFQSVFAEHHLYSEILILPFYQTFNVLRQGSITEIMRYFILLCQQVSQLHRSGYLHTDIKLQHCAILENQVKLLDLAQIIPLNVSQSIQHLAATPAYMAPELFQGKPFSIQTDIYALGIILYILLHGRKPFQAYTYYDWAVQHCQQEIPLLHHAVAQYQNCIDRMLAKQYKNRFVTVDELIYALKLVKKQ